MLHTAQIPDKVQYPKSGLESEVIRHRLNQIDHVRSQGIGDCISLPQLVVCGDQSSGKSSVLTGVTGFLFPRKDGLCTRFATEIVIRHSRETESISASIVPSRSRRDGSETSIRKFQRTLTSTEELPSIVEEAARAMGIRGYVEGEDAPAFSADVLRVEIVGNTGICLTLVDLPGLISVSDYEEGEPDLELVNNLVDSYLMNTRSIILAVIQASNDIQNQRVLQRARVHDRSGERTIGIITKPDLINRGTEPRIAQLANNIGPVRLKLGFFIVKNAPPEHLERGISMTEWRQNEINFFHTAPWKELQMDERHVGVDCLRHFLETTLEQHIEREVPKVCDEIEALLCETRSRISELGDERSSVAEQRKYLLKVSMEYVNLIGAASDGRYQEAEPKFFGDAPSQPSPNRLRASIHNLNTEFAAYMRNMGQKRKICVINHEDTEDRYGSSTDVPQPMWVTEEKFFDWVKRVYKNTRGLELPGSDNHVFLSELFHEQSSRWPAIATQHLRQVYREATNFARRALAFVVKDRHVLLEITKIVNLRMEQNLQAAQNELRRICGDEKIQPITYNHYYTDTVQKARSSRLKKSLRDILTDAPPIRDKKQLSAANVEEVLAAVDKCIIPDMDHVACEDAKESLNAYYKVSMKTFVDNVCRQVLERHIMRRLCLVFGPMQVGDLSDERIHKVASESPHVISKRQELKGLAEALEKSLHILSDVSPAEIVYHPNGVEAG